MLGPNLAPDVRYSGIALGYFRRALLFCPAPGSGFGAELPEKGVSLNLTSRAILN